ncbi:MAG: NAD(+)/NADH kinase [Anaerolineales bacterium]|nr:MAG: NAD(+)/NADH kinase [Anaerolineales bacterium]
MGETRASKFKHVAVLASASNAQAVSLCEDVVRFLQGLGLAADSGLLQGQATQQQLKEKGSDLVIALGGDGTMLRAGQVCAPLSIPLIGINHGNFGFLIELGPDEWQQQLPRLVSGDYSMEKRMLLQVDLRRGDTVVGSWHALNEAMVGRGRVVRPVHLSASLDRHPLTTYVSDGLIISTPTGSTAYALAAGGPILPPTLRNLLLLPVAPHLSVDRAIVLAEGASITVELERGDEAVLSVDGQPPEAMQIGDRVDVRASEHSLHFLRFREASYFYQRLLSLMANNPSTGAAA